MVQTAIRTEAGHTYDAETRGLLLDYIIQLADTSLILSQRLTEWCGHGPILEQDIAMSNIALDLLGETRNLFQYAAEVEGQGRSEDDVAYLRVATDYKNPLLVEMPNGNFADTVVREFIFDTWHYYFLQQLKHKRDNRLAAIAEKSFKEASYHIKWSSEWIIRLGDGTEESRLKIEAAIIKLWPYSEELFTMTATEKVLFELDIVPDYELIKKQWIEHVTKVFESATLTVPSGVFMQKGGKEGRHTEELGFILSDLQYMQRTYPGMEW